MFSKLESIREARELVLCAVSGGADSMCLLHLLKTKGFNVAVLHFNHRLRAENADRDERFVREYCQKNGIAFYCGSADVSLYAAQNKLGIEEAARNLRYEFFEKQAKALGAGLVATAHTADDNLETMLFNLSRGAGLRGLSGIPFRRGIYIRPILGMSRAEVEAYLLENNLEHIEDETNLETEFARNKIRHKVVPVLKEINGNAAKNSLRTSELLRLDDEFLCSLAEKYKDRGEGVGTAELLSLHYSVASRVIRLSAEHFGVKLSAVQVKDVLEFAKKPKPSGKIPLPGGLYVYRQYGLLFFGNNTEYKDEIPETVLQFGKWTKIQAFGLEFYLDEADKNKKINRTLNTFLFEKAKICGNIVVRARKTGDKIKLYDGAGTKSLKKLFIEMKIPAAKRREIPVICDDNGVIAVPSAGVNRLHAFENNGDALIITVRKC